MKYQIRVKASPMEIVGVPYEKDIFYNTQEEAEEAMKRARDEINSTWAYPHDVPLWIVEVNDDRIGD